MLLLLSNNTWVSIKTKVIKETEIDDLIIDCLLELQAIKKIISVSVSTSLVPPNLVYCTVAITAEVIE